MSNSIRIKSFLMMGLQFFIWGCWLPLVYSYLPSLGFTPAQQSRIPNFRGLFLVPLAIATLAAMVLALFFRPPITRQAAPALPAVAGAENVAP